MVLKHPTVGGLSLVLEPPFGRTPPVDSALVCPAAPLNSSVHFRARYEVNVCMHRKHNECIKE